MTLSISTQSIPGSLDVKLKAIAAAGFDAVDIFEPDFTTYDGRAEDIAKQATELGLRINLLQPFQLSESPQGMVDQKTLDHLARKFDLMQTLGTDLLLVQSAQTGLDPIGVDQFTSDLAKIAERATENHIRIAYLARPWVGVIPNELAALELIREIDKPNLGLALNSFYSLADGSMPARLRDIQANRIFHVNLSDAPKLDQDVRHLAKNFRTLPGQGDLNIAGFTRILVKSGYRGDWSIDGVTDHQSKGDAKSAASDGFRSLVTLLDDVARTEPEFSPELPELAARVYASGFEFIEFAARDNSATSLTNMLSSMCFRMERRHISKPVELWRQGAVNIVVNNAQDGFARSSYVSHGAGVCDMGFRVQDAARTVERATTLGAPVFSQPIGEGELNIPAIRGVGGNVVHFIDQKSDLHRVWNIEFEPAVTTEAKQPAGIRRIDHIAQTMKQDEMQSWLLYFVSTFEMEKTPLVEVTDPSGVIQSQTVSSPEGEVRLNLNSTDTRSTFAGAFLEDHTAAGVQHIALLTDDIFETSDQLAASGFERLVVPTNYYDDLQGEFGLDDEFVDRLRQGDIFYDRNGDAEYFQIYSRPIFDGFFFEIVERRNGYDGYGARNAAFRLAAQMKYLRPLGLPKA